MFGNIVIILAVLAGILVKLVDYIEDRESKNLKNFKFPLALLYGLVIGYLISYSTFSMIFLAALLAQALTRKIDCCSHLFGFAISMLSLFYFGFPPLLLTPFLIFLVFASLDEIVIFRTFRFMHDYRLFLPLGGLIYAFSGNIDYLIGILSFDFGYTLITKIFRTS